VKVNLLEEVGVFGRTLVALRITRVVEAGAVGLPGDAAAGSGEIDAGNDVAELFTGGYFKHMSYGIFRAVLGERGRNVLAAERRNEEIHGERSLCAGCVRIEDDAGAGRVIGKAHRDQQRLLQGRLVLLGKQHSGAKLQTGICHRAGGRELTQAVLNGIARGHLIEIFAGSCVLRSAPLLDRGIVPVLEPAIVVGDFDALVFVGDGVPGRVRRLRDRRTLREGRQGEQTNGERNRQTVRWHGVPFRQGWRELYNGSLVILRPTFLVGRRIGATAWLAGDAAKCIDPSARKQRGPQDDKAKKTAPGWGAVLKHSFTGGARGQLPT